MAQGRNTGSSTGAKPPARPWAGLVAMALVLTGCAGEGGLASRMNLRPADTATVPAEGGSALISGLQARRSVLPPGGSYARVADAVLEADAGAAAAELRIARLRSEARAKNWLPNLGPAVTLTSLNGLAAGLLLEQALFDHGKRKAERAYAAADVEVAAVTLSSDINQRVFDGLTHYVNAERARAQGAVSARATGRLADFADVMRQRVEGGLSDRSEMQVIAQKLVEMQATQAADREAEISATAELAAMAAMPVDGVRGIDRLSVVGNTMTPLSLVKAQGEGARAIAESRIARAGLMPGLTANADLTSDGIEPGLRLGGAGLLGWGSKEEKAALDATGDVVARRIAEAGETAERRIVALERQIAQLQGQQAEGAAVLAQTEGNLDLFTEQYKLGRRTLLELVGQYDSFARLERDQVSLSYSIALLELEIARDRGVLVDGARM
ncbi:TolC family protein [Tabrizicola oligotrophica]|uniref:TolC family protein n=1 Tax=Tabrizicola oligotrophica TaxID=2710650 RepID=A0A6M0QUK1_9RHOB|nr:TolC family protein [Tabrizicola oligotrophica]NEY91166.1 TolC family protein [Tabrizicola oligotrophica]